MTRARSLLPWTAVLAALLLLATPAWAAEGVSAPPEGSTEGMVRILLVVVLVLLACVGTGATALLLRVILPGVARSADASLARLGTGRLLLGGVLPLVGAALLARGVELTGSGVLGGIYALLVVLPLAVALVLGAMAALPHLGAQVLRADADPSPLARGSVGGLVVGLAAASWLLRPLGVAVSVLFAGWLLGIGIGAILRRPTATATDAIDAEG